MKKSRFQFFSFSFLVFSLSSALPLLMLLEARADHKHHAAAPDDAAMLTHFFDGRTYFHG